MEGAAYQLVFHRRSGTGEKLTTDQIISDVEFDNLWGADFNSRMSEEDLEQTHLKGIIYGDVEATRAVIDEAIMYLHSPGLKLPNDRIKVIIQAVVVGALEDYKKRI